MNIHEHQAKEILREFGAPVSEGQVILSIHELKEKISKLKSKEFVLKAQIHAGGRGKAGGVKLIKDPKELEIQAKKMMGKVLITHQTGPEGKKIESKKKKRYRNNGCHPHKKRFHFFRSKVFHIVYMCMKELSKVMEI